MAVQGDNSLYFKTGLDNSGLKAGSSEAVSIVEGMSKNISKINPFAALAIAAVASMAVISKAAFDMAQEFETAMKEVETISAATAENYDDISKKVFQLSKISTDKPAALAKAYYQIVSAGYDGAKGLELLTVASKAAIGGITDTETAADGLTTVLNAFKLEAEDSGHVADVLFQTVKLGKTTFSELAANMSTVAPIAAASGVSFEEVAAAIATLTKSGVPTAQAMTQIRSAIIGTNEALGDGWSNAYTLQEAFQLLYDKAGGSQTALQGLVGRVEAVSGVLGVAGINAATAAADFESIKESTGVATEAFDTMINTNANQWKLFGNNVRSTVKGLGDSLLNLSSGIARGLNLLFKESKSATESLIEQRDAVNKLVFEYKSANTSAERRIEVLKELKAINPAIVGGLGTEEDKYVLLNDQVKAYNSNLSTRIFLEKELNNLNKLKETGENFKALIVDLQSRAELVIENLFKSVEQGGAGLSEQGQAEFNRIIGTYYESNIEKIQDLGKILNEQGGKLGELVYTGAIKNFPISAAERDLKRYKQTVTETLFDIDSQQTEINKSIIQNIKYNESATEWVSRLLEQYQDLDKVSKDIGVDVTLIDVPEIQEQIKLIQAAAAEIEKINNITKEDFKADKNIFGKYLESENEQIRKAAEERKKLLEYKPTGGAGGDKDDTFAKQLQKQKEAYEAYQLALKQKDVEFAKELKDKYNFEQETYVNYLKQLYNETQDYYEKIQILKEISAEGGEIRQKLEPISQPVTLGPVEVNPDYVQSLESMYSDLDKLEDEYRNTNNKKDRDALKEKIEIKRLEIDVAEGNVQEEAGLYDDLNRTISGLSRKELKNYIADKREQLNKLLGIQSEHENKISSLQRESIATKQLELNLALKNEADNIDKIKQLREDLAAAEKQTQEEFVAAKKAELEEELKLEEDNAKNIATLRASLADIENQTQTEIYKNKKAQLEEAIRTEEESVQKISKLREDVLNAEKATQDSETKRAELADALKIEADSVERIAKLRKEIADAEIQNQKENTANIEAKKAELEKALQFESENVSRIAKLKAEIVEAEKGSQTELLVSKQKQLDEEILLEKENAAKIIELRGQISGANALANTLEAKKSMLDEELRLEGESVKKISKLREEVLNAKIATQETDTKTNELADALKKETESVEKIAQLRKEIAEAEKQSQSATSENIDAKKAELENALKYESDNVEKIAQLRAELLEAEKGTQSELLISKQKQLDEELLLEEENAAKIVELRNQIAGAEAIAGTLAAKQSLLDEELKLEEEHKARISQLRTEILEAEKGTQTELLISKQEQLDAELTLEAENSAKIAELRSQIAGTDAISGTLAAKKLLLEAELRLEEENSAKIAQLREEVAATATFSNDYEAKKAELDKALKLEETQAKKIKKLRSQIYEGETLTFAKILRSLKAQLAESEIAQKDNTEKIKRLKGEIVIADKQNQNDILKQKKDELKKELDAEKDNAEKIAKLRGEILEAQKAQGALFQETIGNITGILGEASELFRKFGEDDVADLLDQLSGVAEGIGTIAQGALTGNPFAIIEGSLKVLNSAITIEIESDTAKFEKQIEELTISLTKLGRAIQNSIGLDKVDKRIEQLETEGSLLEANRSALEAELEARKKVKFLGITVGKKGKGSGTDEEKVKEFEDAIDEIENKLIELQREIYQLLTGTTADSITDSIIKGFEDGKSSIEDFTGTFEDLMKKAILESFKLQYLEKATQGFFELFGSLAQTDNQLTASEIAILREQFGILIENSKSELEALNSILDSAGIAGGIFGDTAEADGLSGQIRRDITEETGTILAGLMRRIADDVSSGLAAGREAVENLILIQANTYNAVLELQKVNVRLDLIEDNTRQSLLHDLGG